MATGPHQHETAWFAKKNPDLMVEKGFIQLWWMFYGVIQFQWLFS